MKYITLSSLCQVYIEQISTNGVQVFSVPVHRGKVKHVYYREIKKILGEG